MNLPNAITAARIAAAPFIAALPFASGSTARLAAFVLFIAAAVTDYWDGHLARTRNLVTDLGRLLDPLADKLLLVATLIPMLVLMGGPLLLPADVSAEGRPEFAFATPAGFVALPWWVVAVVVGREAFMTAFRQLAVRRGVVIAAIGPAKWKTGFQSTWVGAAYFWFFANTLARNAAWEGRADWQAFAYFNGVVGALSMAGAVALTLYSLWLYLRRYGGVLRR
ncbi:CDP-alcohol phosphatidyltransferase family protein [Roseisolibacter sp. H3M3-2]|uniref:CDP-alcohol phosphatidyltransferase family protein n=1 Tax=Roseisolibacter sp. H3M3-2 TaxID=3031323 RepID=UPI0023DCA987|nr:CDP-alcohol phosphatidyltransferase family protein [Roseisolibacter sp. H3M3-2]MDF1505648.1 CDP-alcohol phosphatidyltransferase family protein [Roseisolibacter sp. H3M3-2]